MRTRLCGLGLGALASLFLSAGSVRGEARILEVGSSHSYKNLGEAVEAAGDGDTIRVYPGYYQGSLVIDRSLKLLAEGEVRISGGHRGDVLLIKADDVEVRGFIISGSGSGMMASDAGIKVEGKRANIRENTLEDNLFGIYLKGCTYALIEGNRIEGRKEDPLGKRGAGVHFYDAHHNRVERNRIKLVRDGVYFDHSDFNLVAENEFSHLRYGVHYMYCEDNRFVRNIFRDSVAGVAVMYTERVVFRENQIIDNRAGYNAFGLLLKDCLDSVAERNVIVNNVNGIFLDSSHRNRFHKNLVAYNDVGVVLYASSLENSFSENDFIQNQAVLHTVGKADADWVVEGKGNYYSGYRGFDLDGNGIGDLSYHLQDAFEYLQGSRPRLRLFLNSAAADALALAETSFPLVPTSDEVDDAPLMRPGSGVQIEAGRPRRYERGVGSPAFLASLGGLLGAGFVYWRLSR